jgi:hypothetical protein
MQTEDFSWKEKRASEVGSNIFDCGESVFVSLLALQVPGT